MVCRQGGRCAFFLLLYNIFGKMKSPILHEGKYVGLVTNFSYLIYKLALNLDRISDIIHGDCDVSVLWRRREAV